MFCPHARVESLAVNQDAIGGGSHAFYPADKAAFTGQRIDFVKAPLSFAHQVDGVFRANDGASSAFIAEASFDIDEEFVRAPSAHVLRLFL